MEAKNQTTFGKELRRVRREENKTLEDVAEIMKVSIPHISDIERGRRSPPPRGMLAKILGEWGRLEELDTLAELAVDYRGSFERTPKNAAEKQVLVALDRALDNEPSEDEIQKLREFLAKMGEKKHG
jgi:transcriptional regulator with XRE-family HTH domain